MGRGQVRELGGQLGGRGIRRIDERVEERQTPGLLGQRIGHLGVPMANVDAPEACNSVQVAPAIHVEHIGTPALRDDESAFLLETREVGKWVDAMVSILTPQRLGVVA